MIARAALQARAREWGLTEEIVEKDYVLGWLLWGVGSHPALADHWGVRREDPGAWSAHAAKGSL